MAASVLCRVDSIMLMLVLSSEFDARGQTLLRSDLAIYRFCSFWVYDEYFKLELEGLRTREHYLVLSSCSWTLLYR